MKEINLIEFTEELLEDEQRLRKLIEAAWVCAYKLSVEMRPGRDCCPRAEYETLVDFFENVGGLEPPHKRASRLDQGRAAVAS